MVNRSLAPLHYIVSLSRAPPALVPTARFVVQELTASLRYKLNIENAEDVAHEYGVNAVPTFMVFKDGGMLPEEKITGPYDRQVKEAIEKCLKQ